MILAVVAMWSCLAPAGRITGNMAVKKADGWLRVCYVGDSMTINVTFSDVTVVKG